MSANCNRSQNRPAKVFHSWTSPGAMRCIHPVSTCFLLVLVLLSTSIRCMECLDAAEGSSFARSTGLLRQFCFECHGSELVEGRLNLEQLTTEPSFNSNFRDWMRIAKALAQKKMPPKDMPQPNDIQRQEIISGIQSELQRVARQDAGTPGTIVMRRLTNAEYSYSIRDLTGLDLELRRTLVGDAVGGEGFTNVGSVQFVQDSTLERYLEAARTVASHAVIGAGPLQFHDAPGKSGFELSAITRIQGIYRANGFRTAAGEGGEAFGLELYPQTFYVAWRYKHRKRLGLPNMTLASLAADHSVSARFAEHIWSILTDSQPTHPTSEIVAAWRKLPAPNDDDQAFEADIRRQCDDLFELLQQWQTSLGQNADDKEEAALLAEDTFDVRRTKSFILTPIRTRNVSQITIHLKVAVVHPGHNASSPEDSSRRTDETQKAHNPLVIWRNPSIQFRHEDLLLEDPKPISSIVSSEDARRLAFGKHPGNGNVDPHDIVTSGVQTQSFVLPIPEGVRSARLIVDAELDVEHGDNCIVQCSLSDSKDSNEWKSVTGLLGNPNDQEFKSWSSGVLDFAQLLPQISHREPAPSDRDPIPLPFDNTYNNPERNGFHYKIKYSRNDQFLMDHILNDQTRLELDHAWSDLLGSFEYHNAFLRFVAEKFSIDLDDRHIAELDSSWIKSLPQEARRYIRPLFDEYSEIQNTFQQAQSGHVEDVLQFAERAWRRPLTDDEKSRFRRFYRQLREESQLNHRQAIRALLTRSLMAPGFLYRAERPSETKGATPLTNWELASRLSYFLWSSLPDAELRRVAAAGELTDSEMLNQQIQRMLRDPKARRFAVEFFGQWFGFYQFDQYTGVDTQRFPEFTEPLKAAMYDEAVSFFEHIVRQDRSAREILFADYAFMNRELAKHYGMTAEAAGTSRIENAKQHQRGGLLGLGAVLTVTSAPLRTSPVKRGDWILRRILDSPVPPPPADAGSIAADDVRTDGLTIRQRLEAHRSDPACMNCHSRIDPLGFALEHYDALGRWRENYRDGQPINSSGHLNDGSVISGPDGLRDFLEQNEEMFQRTLCRKLMGYALGRRELLTDSALIDQMLSNLKHDGRFSTLVRNVVQSRQFRYSGEE